MFPEPWEVHVFAVTLSLYASCFFKWEVWSNTLGALFHEADQVEDPEVGNT